MSAHKLVRLRNSINNKPQLMALDEFEQVLAYLDSSIEKGREVVAPAPKMEDESEMHNSRYTIYEDDKAAIFSIEGPMTYKPVSMFGMDCGGFSYQQFKQDFKFVAESGVKTIGLMIDSGGGEAHQLFASMEYARKIADKHGIKIVSMVDGMAASAAYGAAAISDEIIMTEDSSVGSIGVVVRLMNDSKALAKEGYERTFVTAGREKVPYDAEGNFKESFIQDIQKKIDVMYEDFVGHVAKYRNISTEQVRSTEARTFLSSEAIALGLADKSMTLESFYEYFAGLAEQRAGGNMLPKTLNLFNLNKKEDTSEMMKLEELQAAVSELQAALGAKEEMLAGYVGQMAQKDEQLSVLAAQLQEKESLIAAALAKAEEAQAVSEATKKEMKLKDRTAQLAVAMPADAAGTMAASLEALDDTAFAGVLAGFTAQAAALQASDLFKQLSTSVEEVEEQQEATASVDVAAKATRDAMKARGM